jgi:hypothetical protein
MSDEDPPRLRPSAPEPGDREEPAPITVPVRGPRQPLRGSTAADVLWSLSLVPVAVGWAVVAFLVWMVVESRDAPEGMVAMAAALVGWVVVAVTLLFTALSALAFHLRRPSPVAVVIAVLSLVGMVAAICTYPL